MFNKIKELFKSVLKNESTIIINGEIYKGSNSISIVGNNNKTSVIIDGKEVHTENSMELNIQINGDCGDIHSTNGNITISGNAKDVSTTNGDISISQEANNIQTVNGDIRVRNVRGNINTVNGDITV